MGTTTTEIHYRKMQKISEATNILGHVQGMAKKRAGDLQRTFRSIAGALWP